MAVMAVWPLVAFTQCALAVTSDPQSLWPGGRSPSQGHRVPGASLYSLALASFTVSVDRSTRSFPCHRVMARL